MSDSPKPPPRSLAPILIAIVVMAFAFRATEAWTSSFWLDELHSIGHGSEPDLPALWEHTHWDFHPPLFFMTIHAFGGWASGHWLRLIPILTSLLAFIPLWRFARRAACPRTATVISALFLAALPFQIHYGCELRAYATLGLMAMTCAWAAFTDDGHPLLRGTLFALAVAVGINSNYLMGIVVIFVGITRVLMYVAWRCRWLASPLKALHLGWVMVAGGVGASAFLPWLLNYMFWVVQKPQELVPVERPKQHLDPKLVYDALMAPVRSVVPSINALSSPLWVTLIAIGCGVLAIALVTLVVLAFAAWRRTPRAERRRTDPSLVAALVFGVVCLTLLPPLSIFGFHRVSLQYFMMCSWVMPLAAGMLFAALPGGDGRPRSPLAGRAAIAATWAVVGLLLMGVAEAGGGHRENIRGAVQTARDLVPQALGAGGEQPVFTALLEQPPLNKKGVFEHRTPYLAYAPDLRAVEPDAVPAPGSPEFARPLIIVTRGVHDITKQPESRMAAVTSLRAGRRERLHARVDDEMDVWVFEPIPK